MKRINFILLGCSFIFGSAGFAASQKQITVGPEDTVYGLAYSNGLPTRALIAANNLKPPYTLKPGQVLIIPAANEHIVGNGESLQSISEEYGVRMDVLAQENGIQSPFFVKPGDHLMIPSRDTEPLAEALKPSSAEITTSTLAPLPLVKSEPMPRSRSEAQMASTNATGNLPDDLAEELAREKGTSDKSANQPNLMANLSQKKAEASITSSKDTAGEKKKPKKEAKKEEKKPEKKEAQKKEKQDDNKDIAFIWPVKGEVITKFSAGGKNDGINIKVPKGTIVKASASGTVMYAGNELKDFGNLLLIKHKDGWVTAYAHNSSLLVKKGDTVKQGQEIAKTGKIGGVGEPQLHFEIRKIKQPIDPLTKLGS